MSITITVPNDDHVALRAMAKALEEIAVARGAPLQVNLVTEEMLEKLKETRSGNIICEPKVDTTSQQFESLATHIITSQEKVGDPVDLGDGNFSQGYRIEVEELPATDSTSTPWDERIHSASKALNGDGTWRLRRKPKDMDETEWSDYVESVKSELDRLCKDEGCAHHGTLHECVSVQLGNPDDPEAPLAEEWDGVSESIPEPSVTPAGDDFHVDAGEVTEQQVASIPVPPLPVPPVFATVQEVDKLLGLEPTMTFPQVMQFLTERHGRITSAQVDDIIADMGLNSIMDLNTQPEHTGPFIARVKALLGE